MKTRTIRVTKRHIEEGKPGDANSCPIALAMQDAGFDNPTVMPGLEGITFYDKSGNERRAIGKVTRFIQRFDKITDTDDEAKQTRLRKALKPFKFILRIFGL